MNKTLFLYINSFAQKSNFLDMFFITSAEIMPFIFIGIEVWLYFFANKKKEAVFAFYSMLIALLISAIIKLFYFHNRPFMDGIGVLLTYHAPESSFPSDHTTFLFSIAFSYLFSKLKKLALLSLFLAFLCGVARVYVGVHYPFDIMGGIFVGFIGAFVVFLLKDRLEFVNEIIFKIEKKILKHE
jgi:undecaprenyl-diphosphatase